MRRREFIRSVGLGAAAVASAGVVGCTKSDVPATKGETAARTADQAIKSYREIGTTGLKMSDISMGCGQLDNPYVVERAIDVGINYFDTAPDYGNGQSEITLGKVFKDPAKRDKCIICTKICERGAYGQHLNVGSSPAEVVAVVEGSLKRLNTDHIDLIMVHAIGERENDLPRLTDPGMLEAVARLKEQGKIGHLGVSSHGPHCMEDCLTAAIESGHYAMFMPAYNFVQHDRLGEVLQKAREKGVGVVAMKTLSGAKEEDLSRFQADGSDLAAAAFKWVFTNPAVSGLVVTMRTSAEVDKYAAASGKRFAAEDQGLLNQYSTEIWSEYCRTGCGDCLPHCPHGVAIAEIMRYDMYFTAYGDHYKAMKGFHDLPPAMRPNACRNCSAPCLQGCGYNLAIRDRLLEAADRLQFV